MRMIDKTCHLKILKSLFQVLTDFEKKRIKNQVLQLNKMINASIS